MLKRILSWPWAQALLWVVGILALLIGAGGDYGTNWGPISVGGILIGAAIALGFLRLQRQRLERAARSSSAELYSEPPVPQRQMASGGESDKIERVPPASQNKDQRGGWWRGALNLIVVVLAIAAGRGAVQYFTSLDDPSRMSDAELIQQLETAMADHVVWPTFQRLQTDFPEEYDVFVAEMVQVVRSGGDQAEAYARGQALMTHFFERQRPFIRRGSSTSLSRALETQATFLRSLLSARPDVCAEAVETGTLPADDGLAILPDYSVTMNTLNGALFDAILTGRQSTTERAAITDQEWDIALLRAEALGADMVVLNALAGGSAAGFTDEQKCGTAVALYMALTEGNDIELEARFAAELFAPMQ